jgi:hypothetical protein
MSGNAAFAVPKDRLNVIIRLEKGISLQGEIFLEYFSDSVSLHQKVAAFLENETLFFPIKVSTGGTEFLNKQHVRCLEVLFPDDPDASYFSHRPMQAIPVNVIFPDGETISGELIEEVPAEKARLSDCLNMQNKFLNVKTATTICYLNKQALQKVVHA